MSKKSKKAKKMQKPRPIFRCKCGAYWVSDADPICYHCNVPGMPQNESGKRLLKWRLTNDGNTETRL